MKYLTRKNPYYMAVVMILQLTAAILFLNRPEPDLVIGGFMLWALGCNCGYLLAGNPPDAF